MNEKDNARKNVIYMRLVLGDDDELKRQEEILRQYTSKLGITIDEVYVDNGYSGRTYDRPGFKRLISDVKDNKISYIYIKDISRLGRDSVELSKYIYNVFPKYGVTLISVDDNNIDGKFLAEKMVQSFNGNKEEIIKRMMNTRRRVTTIRKDGKIIKKEETVRE